MNTSLFSSLGLGSFLRRLVFTSVAALCALPAHALDVGVAKMDVTPTEPIRLTGYASRKSNSSGVEQKLWAKALVFGSEGEGATVLVTLDNCGIAETTYQEFVARMAKKANLKPERIAIACSHTHSGPCTTGWAPNIFAQDIPPEHQAAIDRYTRDLLDKLEQVVFAAMADRRPGKISWAQGSVGFARNRRVVAPGGAQFGDNAGGPVDHSLPVLKVQDADGKLRALVANYACHCTTLGGEFNKTCGDWAGYAQEAIERDHPGAMALITIGCGADANPSPRGGADSRLALAKQHGEEIAAEVKRLLALSFTPLAGPPTARLKHIELPFGPQFTREEWQARAQTSGIVGYHAKKWLTRLDRGEKLPDTLSYYVQSWSFGADLALVFLSGEVVVDYALRLKQEFDATRLWVSSYANYVPCYIPSRRILAEGGYEAESSLWYYDRPARLSTNAEDLIVQTVHELVPKEFLFDKKKAEFPDPKTPEQALACFRTHADLIVELVASEPLIESPVAIDWGADGRLWVCEMYDYPAGLDGKFKPGGRIKVLQSTKGDGHYDKATLFLDGLAFPTGVMPWRKGALICAAPDILYAEDTDGDGRADVVRTNFTGFATHNYQARVNGFRWGLDGWLHGSSGLFGGKVKSLLTGKEIDLSGRDFRLKPDTGEIEPVAGLSQMGRVRDDFGNWFGNDNGTLLWHYPLPDHYAGRNPHVSYPDPRVNVVANRGADAQPNQLFPASRTLERFNDPSAANHVTSACGPEIYRDDLLGTNYAGNAFICEPVHNLVTRRVLAPRGATFTAQRAPDERQSEFLASTDNWFRPVQARTGPDGALWIVDMYRFVVEHPRWIPPARLKELDARAGANQGRIYKIYPRGATLRGLPDLSNSSLDDLAMGANTLNGPTRDLIHREFLLRKPEADALPAKDRLAASQTHLTLLTMFATKTRIPSVRAHAEQILMDLNSLKPTYLVKLIQRDPSGFVRAGVVRLSEPFVHASLDLHLDYVQRIDDPSPEVRYQLALTLGGWNERGAGHLLGKLALQNDDPWMRAAILSSAVNQPAEILKTLLAATNPPDATLVGPLFATGAGSGNEPEWQAMLRMVTPPGSVPWRWGALASLLEALDRRNLPLAALASSPKTEARDAAERLRQALAEARRLAADTGGDQALCSVVLRLLGRDEDENAKDLVLLAGFLQPGTAAPLQSAAFDSLRRQRGAGVAELLLKNWNQNSPAFRANAVNLMLNRDEWAGELLKAIEQKAVSSDELPLPERQRLLKHAKAPLRERAEKVFSAPRSTSRAEVLAKYQVVATLAGLPGRGLGVFSKNCSACHAHPGEGHPVGPSLAEFAGKSAQDFVVAIFDPNTALHPKFLTWIVETKDGRNLTGIVKGETASGFTLVQGGGIEEKLLRGDTREIRASPLSLMPEGLEQSMSPQDVADLIAWVKQAAPARDLKPLP